MTSRRQIQGFTLVELLVATAILLVLAVLLVNLLGGMSKAWLSGQAKMVNLQSGRAIVDFISRDLRSLEAPEISAGSQSYLDITPIALPSGTTVQAFNRLAFLQFVQDAGQGTNGLTPWLPNGQKSVPNSGNCFGQMRGSSTSKGNLWIVGYYLATTTNGIRTLFRVAVPPDATNNAYQLYASAAGAKATNATSSWYGVPGMYSSYAQPIAEHVAALYITCLDSAGKPIPWLSAAYAQASPMKFNSAASFSMLPSQAAADAAAAGQPAFSYLDQTTGAPSHQLPAALRIDALVLDESYRKRNLTLPDPPALATPGDASEKVTSYQQTLYNLGIRSSQIFSATVDLNSRP